MKPFQNRRLRLAGLASILAISVAAQGGVVSNASWNDSEFVNAQVGTLDCKDASFQSRGDGQFLSGSVLTEDLSTLAELQGVEILNNGQESTLVEDPTIDLPDDDYSDPLSINALSLVNLDLTDLVKLPLDSELGVIGQYAQAKSNGKSSGSSGLIEDSGAIDLNTASSDMHVATLALSDLVGAVSQLWLPI